MASAFRTGTYAQSEMSFGSGQYGSLEALVAALILDREARTPLLDSDPAHGAVLEPFGKIVRVMRSLDYGSTMENPAFRSSVQPQIGQLPHHEPSVFSFFLPEFSPPGSIGTAQLTCPECQVLTGPKAVALVNGLSSLVKYGADGAFDGFFDISYEQRLMREKRTVGDFGPGHLMYETVGEARKVVDDLATLLTSGRLSSKKRVKLVELYQQAYTSTSSSRKALILLEQLILTTPEFHTNALSDGNGKVIPPADTSSSSVPSSDYKAVLYLVLAGGADTHNFLIPHECSAKNDRGVYLHTQFAEIRGELAIANSKRIVDASGQPCEKFAIHPGLPIVEELYQDGDLAFFANVGVMSESGMDKQNYGHKTRLRLNAHNHMEREVKRVDPDDKIMGTGLLGRLASHLRKKGYRTAVTSVGEASPAVQVEPGDEVRPLQMNQDGYTLFDERPLGEEDIFDIEQQTKELNAASEFHMSMFGETWSAELVNGIRLGNEINTYFYDTKLGSHWNDLKFLSEYSKTKTIAKMIKAHKVRNVDRDFFNVVFGGWDHHADLLASLDVRVGILNRSLKALVKELKDNGLWDDITIVVGSEFGRTLTPNGNAGADHAWAGNYFIMGGGVKGKNVHGRYPSDLTEEGPMNIGRGRMLPDMSWEAIFNGISEWVGVDGAQGLDYCLPNRHLTTGNGAAELFTKDQLYNGRSLRH